MSVVTSHVVAPPSRSLRLAVVKVSLGLAYNFTTDVFSVDYSAVSLVAAPNSAAYSERPGNPGVYFLSMDLAAAAHNVPLVGLLIQDGVAVAAIDFTDPGNDSGVATFPGFSGGLGIAGSADADFEFTPVGATTLPVVSVEYLKAAVVASVAGRLVDATAYAVEFAFVTDTADIGAATWHATEWDDAGRARLLVGPGQVVIAAGAYHWYVRVQDSPESTIRRLPVVLRIEA